MKLNKRTLLEKQLINIIKQILKEGIGIRGKGRIEDMEPAMYASQMQRYEKSLKQAGVNKFIESNESFIYNRALLDEPLYKFARFILGYKKQNLDAWRTDPGVKTNQIKYEAERAARSILSAVVIPGLQTIRETLRDIENKEAKEAVFAANKDLLDEYFENLLNTIKSRKMGGKSENAQIFDEYVDELISYLETYWSKVSALDVDGFAETRLFFENKKIRRGRFVK